MALMAGLVAVSVCGIGIVFWLLRNDHEAPEASSAPTPDKPYVLSPIEDIHKNIQEKPTPAEQSELKSNFLAKLGSIAKKKLRVSSDEKLSSSLLNIVLTKLKLGKKDSGNDDVPKVTPIPNLKDILNDPKSEEKPPEPKQAVQTGTASIKTSPAENPPEEITLSNEEEKKIEKEVEITAELSELKEKYDKLDALFNEKSTELENTKNSLDHELENRKDFNKVKDLLEKEMKDSKDKTRNIEVELNNALSESDRNKKRGDQLEEKTTQLEKNLLQKEDEIGDLIKRVQTFAAPPASPPPPPADDKKEDAGQDQPPSSIDETKVTPPPQEEEKAEKIDQLPANSTETDTTPSPEATPQKSTEDSPQQDSPKEDPAEAGGEATKEETESKSSEELPSQMGGLKLNLNIDDDPKEEEPPADEKPLKLQPDILSGESKEDEPSTSETQTKQTPEDTPDDKTPEQPENNDTIRKE